MPEEEEEAGRTGRESFKFRKKIKKLIADGWEERREKSKLDKIKKAEAQEELKARKAAGGVVARRVAEREVRAWKL